MPAVERRKRGPKPGTAEWLQQKRTADRQRRAAIDAALTAAQRAAVKAAARQRWDANKDKYNEHRRERLRQARIDAGEPVRPVGRPKKNTVVPAERPVTVEQIGKGGPLTRTLPQQAIAVPPDVQPQMGGVTSIAIPNEASKWPVFHVTAWNELKERTRKAYMTQCRSTLRKGGYEPPKTDDPLILGEWMTAQAVDAWRIIRAFADASVATRNAAASAILGVVNQTIRAKIDQKATNDGAWTQLISWMMTYQTWTHHAKLATGERHQSQAAGEHLKAAYIPWPEWVSACNAYIYKYFDTAPSDGRLLKKRPAGLEGLMNAVILACYSQIAPIRNDWATVRIVRNAEPQKNQNSVVVDAEGNVTGVWWGDFKNASSFKNELPIQTDTTAPLRRMLAEWIRVNPSPTWVFPAQMTPDSNYITNFSTFFGNLTVKVIGKRVGVQALRPSYIRWFHETHPDIVKDLASLKRLMKNMHQTAVHVHLAYRKKVTAEEEFDAAQRAIDEESGFYEAQKRKEKAPALAREPVPVIVLEQPAAAPAPVVKKRTRRPKKVVITAGTNPIMQEILQKARALGARTVS
jgi:hypothetical protein